MIKTKVFQNLLILLGFIFLLSVAYWPAVFLHYVFHDDVVYFMTTPTRLEPPGVLFNIAIGRFLGGHLLILLGLLVHSASDLNLVRFLSVFQLSLAGFIFVLWVRGRFLTLVPAFLIAVTMLTLPPFQIMASQAGMGFQPLGIIFGLIAAIFAYRISCDGPIFRRFVNRNAFATFFFFFCALSVYQPAAMFFWAMLGFTILFSKESYAETKARIVNFACLGLVTLGAYMIALQSVRKYFVRFNFFAYNPYVVTTDYLDKLKWFLGEPLISALNLWNIFPREMYAIAVFVFIVGGAILGIIRSRQERSLNVLSAVLVGLVLVVLIFLSFLPNLASENNLFFYRCGAGLFPLVFLMVLAACREYLMSLKKSNVQFSLFAILVLWALFGVFWAQRTIYQHRFLPSQREWQLLTKAFTENNINDYERIYIVRPQEERLRHRGDEYRNLTTRYSHNDIGVVSGLLRDLAQGKLTMYHIRYDPDTKRVLFLFRDARGGPGYYPYQVIVDSGSTPPESRERTLVIDMRVLHDF